MRLVVPAGLLLALIIGSIATPATSVRAAESADAITVHKVDPPGWWIGHTLNPVQLLVRGDNLAASNLRSDTPGVSVTRSTVNTRGDYLTAYVAIDPAVAQPGTARFALEGPAGAASFSFDLQALPAVAGRHQGLNPDDVIYLVMIDRFSDGDLSNNDPPRSAGHYNRTDPRAYHGGDLQGIIDRLPYLKDLGITAIWLTPVYDNSDRGSDYHGYGAVDFYSVDERFGDVAKFRELVERAHEVGIKVIQDQVANHTGPDHPWTDAPPSPTWLNGSRQQHLNNVFDIAAVTRPDPDRNRLEATLRGWFVDLLPDLNQDDPEVAQYLIQNTLWWIAETGIDAIRADTFPYVPRSFWARWNQAIKQQYPQLTVIGEIFDGRPEIVSFFQGGTARFDGVDSRLEMVFDFPSAFAIRDFFSGDRNSLSSVIAQDSVYSRPDALVPFFGNHDISRIATEARLRYERVILAYTYLLTMRGVPQIYYGDEIAMEGGGDPDNRRDFPGGFPGDSRSAFTNDGRLSYERQVFDAVRQLLAVRRNVGALRGGQSTFLREDSGLVAMLRSAGSSRALVLFNNTDESARIKAKLPAESFPEGATLVDLLGLGPEVSVSRKVKVRLPARSAAIYTTN